MNELVKVADSLGLAGAIEKIAALAEQAMKPTEFTPKNVEVPGHGFYISRAGALEWVELPPARRALQLHTLASFVALVRHVHGGSHGPAPKSAQLLVGPGRIEFVPLHDAPARADGLSSATLHLEASPEFTLLRDLEKGRGRSPAELAIEIRDTLSAAVDELPALLTVLRNVRFAGADSREVNVTHTSVAIATDVQRSVASKAEIPEFVGLHVRPWSCGDLQKRYPVRCSLNVLFDKGQIVLRPLAGELNDVIDRAMEDVCLQLAELPYQVYAGEVVA